MNSQRLHSLKYLLPTTEKANARQLLTNMKMSAVWEGLGLLGTSVLPHPVLVNIPAEILAQGWRSQELARLEARTRRDMSPTF